MSDRAAPVAGDRKRSAPSADDVEYLLENDVVDIDTLKQFTIPKKKSQKHDVFTRIEMSSPEARELVRVVHQSFKDRESVDCFVFSRPRLINNANLLDKFTDRRKQMKQNGYTDKELQEIFAFLYFTDDASANKVCSEGLFTNNTDITCLGDPKMGVYLSKHADIISPKPLKNKMFGTMLVLKVIKGRVKLMSECLTGIILDPSPNFDCHVLKSSAVDLSANSLQQIFECTQLYLYEYMEDSELSNVPGQILPYALLNFRYERSARSIPLLATPSLKQSKVERKSGLHASEKKTSKSQGTSGNSVKETELQSNLKQTLTPFNDYQLWSGNVFVSEMSLGFCLLNSASVFIDSTFLGVDIHIKEKVSLEYLKSAILKDVLLSLDRKRETFSGDSCIATASLCPTFSSSTFTSFVEHLNQTSMVGYAVLLDCTEIYFVPSEALKECASLNSSDGEKHSLYCFFVSKHAASSRIPGYVERKLAVNFSRVNPFFNSEKESQGCTTFSEPPASPEIEQSSAKVRDPRLRHKVKSTKPELDSNNKHHSIIGTSRLLSLFEHMSDVQDKMNIEVARRSSHGTRTSYGYSGQSKQESGPNLQQFVHKVDLKASESAATDPPVAAATSISQNVSSPSLDSINSSITPSFKIPETIYATAIADPKVNQLLEELKSKNIIGLGLSPLPEVSSRGTGDLAGVPKVENPENQKKSVRADPRLGKISKADGDIGFSNRVHDQQNQPFSPEAPVVDAFYRQDVVQTPDEQFNSMHQTHMMPYSPGDSGSLSPQFSDQRRRYGSFLPDPKTFQKNFIDNHHQRPHNPYPNKPDPRLNRSRFSHQHPGSR